MSGADFMILLSNIRLDVMRQSLYGRNVEAVFKKVTPSLGESEIGRIKSGFHFQREQAAGREIDGSGWKFWLSKNAGIERSSLHVGVIVDISVNGIATRHSIADLLPMQQVGSGYVLRLRPLNGATG